MASRTEWVSMANFNTSSPGDHKELTRSHPNDLRSHQGLNNLNVGSPLNWDETIGKDKFSLLGSRQQKQVTLQQAEDLEKKIDKLKRRPLPTPKDLSDP